MNAPPGNGSARGQGSGGGRGRGSREGNGVSLPQRRINGKCQREGVHAEDAEIAAWRVAYAAEETRLSVFDGDAHEVGDDDPTPPAPSRSAVRERLPGLPVCTGVRPADRVLERLQGVRRTGDRRWSARCPAHDDRHPSLSLREADDGRILLHCWGGCEAADVVAALGLDMRDLFPPRHDREPGAGTPRERKPWLASDLLRLAAFEASVVVLIAVDVGTGKPIDHARLIEAASRLADLAEEAA